MRTLIGLLCAVASLCLLVAVIARAEDDGFATNFPVDKDELSSTGRNPYFILEPGYSLVLEKGTERVVITVLNDTKKVDGVETRVVEERETKNDKLVEVSRNYFAISKKTKNVYYFGEEVDIYKNDKVVGHEGAWLSGEKGAKFGLIMPGTVKVGYKHYQEIAPKVAMDRAEIVSVTESLETPAGKFKDCLKVEETTPLEPREKEYKYYASGVGLIKDGSLVLVKYGFPEKPKN